MWIPSRKAIGLTIAILCATGVDAAPVRPVRDDRLNAVAARPGFPSIRESMTGSFMDWDSGERVTRTISVGDSEPFLAARSVPCPPPASTRIPPSVPAFAVEDDLSNVVNIRDFGTFAVDQREKLARNGFVVTASTREQMFYIYEENVYSNLPTFVTSDIILHTYSDLFSYLLKRVERRQLFGWVKLLSQAMREESYRQYRAARDPQVKAAALENVVFFAVPEAILKRSARSCPEEIRARVEELKELVERAEVRMPLDFSDYKPRGHYDNSEDWRNYFRAMKWYGEVSFPVKAGEEGRQPLLRIQLIALALEKGRAEGLALREIWSRVEDLVTLFSGGSNYLTPEDARGVMSEVFGRTVTVARLADEGRQGLFFNAALRLPPSPILKPEVPPRQFRFFGRRFVLDTLIMQELVRHPDRLWSSGVDVMDALGLPLARRLTEPEQGRWGWYRSNLERMRRLVAETPDEEWMKGVYPATLWTLSALATDPALPYPAFMRNAAWEAKTLNTASGSWAELRHNTILYAEAFSAEGGYDEVPVELPKGYVEPNDLFFARMLWLVRKLESDLSSRGCLTARAKEKLDLFESIVERCGAIVAKELRGEALNEEECRFIHFIGSQFSQITTGCLLNDRYGEDYERRDAWNALPEGRRNQAVIADVGTSQGRSLEVGIGPAHEIFVVVPTRRGPRLARGAVYQYYEFLHPSAERLTDARWREMLSSSPSPEIPAWSATYRSRAVKPGRMGLSPEDYQAYQYRFVAD